MIDLRDLSPATAELAERIALTLNPDVLSSSSDTLETSVDVSLKRSGSATAARCRPILSLVRRSGKRWST